MADIFISYRRGDGGWAGRLASDLERHFDVFFDTDRDSIDFGDSFPDRINSALEEFRVCLALIGPEWVSGNNMARFADQKDWVRREIEAALSAAVRVTTDVPRTETPANAPAVAPPTGLRLDASPVDAKSQAPPDAAPNVQTKGWCCTQRRSSVEKATQSNVSNANVLRLGIPFQNTEDECRKQGGIFAADGKTRPDWPCLEIP